MDEQSALPSVYGVPAWVAVAIGVLGAILGIVVDHLVGSGELSARFAVIYLLGCTCAAVAVRHRALFTAVVQPPIILFIAVPVAYITFGDASFSIRGIALNVIPLVNRFPLMLFATTVVMTIGAVRLVRNRPRRAARPAAERRATTPSDRKPRTERPAGAAVRPVATDPGSAETERIQSPAAQRRRRSALSHPGPAAGTPAVAATSAAPPVAQPAQAVGDWLASVDPVAPRPEVAARNDDLDQSADRPAVRSTRRPPPRSEAAAGSHGPVRYRPDSVAPRASGWSEPTGAPSEPLFDDAALTAARRTRSGRRFQPEPRVPEHPIPSVRYRGDPPAGY